MKNLLQIADTRTNPEIGLSMHGSEGTGIRLLKHGEFGADLVHFAPGKRTDRHTHPGDHILLVLSGKGWLEYGPEKKLLEQGLIYLVPGSVPHAVGASEGEPLLLLSVANDHRDVSAGDRLSPA